MKGSTFAWRDGRTLVRAITKKEVIMEERSRWWFELQAEQVASVLGPFKLTSLHGVILYPPDLQNDSSLMKGRIHRAE